MPRIAVEAAGETSFVTFDWPGTDPDTPTVTPFDGAAMLASGRAVTLESLTRDTDARTTRTVDGRQWIEWGPNVFQAIMDRAPAGKGIVDMRAVTHEINTPDWQGKTKRGVNRPPLGVTFFGGAVEAGTHFETLDPRRLELRVKPNTSAKDRNILGHAFGWGFSGSAFEWLANVALVGADQGMQSASYKGLDGGPGNDGVSHRVFTTSYWWNAKHGSKTTGVFAGGSFGTNGAPPGESFPLQTYGSTGYTARDLVMARCHTDGRAVAGGPITNAAGITFGNTLRALVVGCSSHHNGQAAFVAYKSNAGRVYDLVMGDAADKAQHIDGIRTMQDWLNLELTDDWTFTRPVWLANKVDGAYKNTAISHSGDGRTINGDTDTSKGRLTIIDPDYRGPQRFNGKPTILMEHWTPYEGKPSNETALNPPVVRTSAGVPILYRRNFGGGWHTVNG